VLDLRLAYCNFFTLFSSSHHDENFDGTQNMNRQQRCCVTAECHFEQTLMYRQLSAFAIGEFAWKRTSVCFHKDAIGLTVKAASIRE
jgi:hypothetical protein